jgi:hypothetical protein
MHNPPSSAMTKTTWNCWMRGASGVKFGSEEGWHSFLRKNGRREAK